MTLGCIAMCAFMPLAVLGAFLNMLRPQPSPAANMLYAAAYIYLLACAVVCVIAVAQRLFWRFHAERKHALVSNHTKKMNLAKECDDPLLCSGVVTWLGRLPGNEVLHLHIQEKNITIPRLAPQHASLRVAHLSDLHMSGRMARPFYERIVEETNHCGADVIAITGDITDSEECFSWIPDILGRLQAPGGVFYVYGNHDLRVNQDGLRAALAATNWTHVGTAPARIRVRNLDVVIGGNERPWMGAPTDFSDLPERDADGLPLRIVLSHSPDQFGWACTNDVDLLLAGHVHGGQICLPVVGPFTAPSLFGVRYAAGTFREGDTVMHVSRGAASLTPLRWFCPPEIAVLNLVPAGRG
jgi:predicted MPP superfamily phosphohydrolase